MHVQLVLYVRSNVQNASAAMLGCLLDCLVQINIGNIILNTEAVVFFTLERYLGRVFGGLIDTARALKGQTFPLDYLVANPATFLVVLGGQGADQAAKLLLLHHR